VALTKLWLTWKRPLTRYSAIPSSGTLGSMMPALKMVEVPFLLLELELTSEMRQMSFVCSCWEGRCCRDCLPCEMLKIDVLRIVTLL